MRQAGDHPGLHGINSVREHDRDGRGRALDRKGRGRCDYYDDVNVQSNHLCRKFLKSLGAVPCIPALNHEVAALRISEFVQALEQRVVKCLVSARDKSHSPNFARLLRARGKRPRRRRAAEQRNELAPPNHSITSSARESKVGGIFKPSAEAAFKLMISSNSVACWTGRSPGFAPLSILST